MLAVVRTLFRAEFRHRWRSWIYLALLVALVSGLVLAGIAAGRRTTSAFPRYLAAYGSDAEIFSFKPIPTIASLPEVEGSAPALIPANGPPSCSGCRLLANQDFGVTGLTPQDLAESREVALGPHARRVKAFRGPGLVHHAARPGYPPRLAYPHPIRLEEATEPRSSAAPTSLPDGPLYDFKVVGTGVIRG